MFRLQTSGSRVARRKSYFLIEKDKVGQIIDYTAITGHLKNVPGGVSEAAFAQHNAAMMVDEGMVEDTLAFETLLNVYADLEEKINREHL